MRNQNQGAQADADPLIEDWPNSPPSANFAGRSRRIRAEMTAVSVTLINGVLNERLPG